MASAAKYGDLRAETSSAFDKLGSFLADLCDGTEDHHEPPEKPNLDTNLGSFYETFTALKARHADQNLTVAVLALTKSGEYVHTGCLPGSRLYRKLSCRDVVEQRPGTRLALLASLSLVPQGFTFTLTASFAVACLSIQQMKGP